MLTLLPVTLHIIPHLLTVPLYATLRYTTLHYTTHHITSHHIILHHITPHHIILTVSHNTPPHTTHHTTLQTIIQLAMGDIVTADRTFLEHLSDSHYIISQECRLAETFLNALKNRDADLVSTALYCTYCMWSTVRAVCGLLYVLYVVYCKCSMWSTVRAVVVCDFSCLVLYSTFIWVFLTALPLFSALILYFHSLLLSCTSLVFPTYFPFLTSALLCVAPCFTSQYHTNTSFLSYIFLTLFFSFLSFLLLHSRPLPCPALSSLPPPLSPFHHRHSPPSLSSLFLPLPPLPYPLSSPPSPSLLSPLPSLLL